MMINKSSKNLLIVIFKQLGTCQYSKQRTVHAIIIFLISEDSSTWYDADCTTCCEYEQVRVQHDNNYILQDILGDTEQTTGTCFLRKATQHIGSQTQKDDANLCKWRFV